MEVKRGSHGFGLSLVYRGVDLFEENDTGVFVSKLVPGGNAQRAGLKKNDKVLKNKYCSLLIGGFGGTQTFLFWVCQMTKQTDKQYGNRN